MRIIVTIFLTILVQASALACDISTEQHIEEVFTELRSLRPMQAGQSYTVSVAGSEETGRKEQFLRRRTAHEIAESGLSCGCGDYAILFIDRIEPRGFEARLVEGAEISSGSLQDHFSGHAVVAIRPKRASGASPWVLVDSTNLKILSLEWLPVEKSFEAFGCSFWIGYCGPLTDYPVHNAQDLKGFYTKTVASVPREFLNHTLCRLRFTVDPSLTDKEGNFLNSRLKAFLQLQPDIFATNQVVPDREINILLTRGSDDTRTELSYSDAAGWVAHLGLKSGCSPSLLSYFEQVVHRHEQPPSK